MLQLRSDLLSNLKIILCTPPSVLYRLLFLFILWYVIHFYSCLARKLNVVRKKNRRANTGDVVISKFDNRSIFILVSCRTKIFCFICGAFVRRRFNIIFLNFIFGEGAKITLHVISQRSYTPVHSSHVWWIIRIKEKKKSHIILEFITLKHKVLFQN